MNRNWSGLCDDRHQRLVQLGYACRRPCRCNKRREMPPQILHAAAFAKLSLEHNKVTYVSHLAPCHTGVFGLRIRDTLHEVNVTGHKDCTQVCPECLRGQSTFSRAIVLHNLRAKRYATKLPATSLSLNTQTHTASQGRASDSAWHPSHPSWYH